VILRRIKYSYSRTSSFAAAERGKKETGASTFFNTAGRAAGAPYIPYTSHKITILR